MRHIMVMNAKGGCGKSTLATNIASYFASEGYGVALADYDPQRSGLDWLDRRPGDIAACYADAGFAEAQLGWTAELDLKAMIEDTWRWQSKNPNGYEDR